MSQKPSFPKSSHVCLQGACHIALHRPRHRRRLMAQRFASLYTSCTSGLSTILSPSVCIVSFSRLAVFLSLFPSACAGIAYVDLSLRQSARSPILKSWHTLVYAVPPARSCLRFPFLFLHFLSYQISFCTSHFRRPHTKQTVKRRQAPKPTRSFPFSTTFRNIHRRSDHISSTRRHHPRQRGRR